jgi:hypothetical protein
LDRAEIDSRFQQMRGETVSQRVNTVAVNDLGSGFHPIEGSGWRVLGDVIRAIAVDK